VTRRSSIVDATDSLSRKRTAEMLRRLRTLKDQVKMLKTRIDEEEETERRPRALRPRHK